MGAVNEIPVATFCAKVDFEMTEIIRDIHSHDVDRTRTARAADARRLMDALRRFLPLMAHPCGRSRTASIAATRRRNSGRRCTVTNVFDAGDAFGLMCQIEVGDGADPAIFVAPIAELAFDRRQPITREIADYRRRRAQTRIAELA
jgi:hypothetical protein